MREIRLEGCAPVPLAAYLKALGVFRLLAEQKDIHIRGCWRDEAFILDTVLTKEEIVRFFLEHYRPSPIISPWNGRAGFLEGEDDEESTRSGAELVRLLQGTSACRFRALKNAVDALIGLQSLSDLNALRYQRKKLEKRRKDGKLTVDETAELTTIRSRESDLKRELIAELRSTVPEQVVEWMDACWRIGAREDAAPPAPLLGSGGNDGSRDLGVNFGQQLGNLFDLRDSRGVAKSGAESALRSAIFGVPAVDLQAGAMGQFAPAQAGPNAGVGFGATAPLNPWDTVLSLEGSVIFAGAATRRLGGTKGEPSFPFTVRATGASAGGSAPRDESEARGEIWMPLWHRPASLAEIAALCSEGRATLRGHVVRDGLDFARAAVTLGVSRGISSFQRYGFMKREGRNYIAAPLTRIRVRRNFGADLLNDLDQGAWVQRFRNYSRSKKVSGRLLSIAARLDEAIFALTQDDSCRAVQGVLTSVGEVVAYLASNSKARNPKEENLKPPPRLSHVWFEAANDSTAEFCIASALAGLGHRARTANIQDQVHEDTAVSETEEAYAQDEDASGAYGPTVPPSKNEGVEIISTPPFRAHLVPLVNTSWYGRYCEWSDNGRLAVWGVGALERNLIAVLERRLLFTTQQRLVGSPFDARAPANLESVLTFLAGETDDGKIAGLVQGLAWAEPPNSIRMETVQPRTVPLAYALLKPFFTPTKQLQELEVLRNGATLPVPTGLVQRLRSGDVGAATGLAYRRARASGLPVTFEPSSKHVASMHGPRLLASLLIPIRMTGLKHALERAYPALFSDKEMPS